MKHKWWATAIAAAMVATVFIPSSVFAYTCTRADGLFGYDVTRTQATNSGVYLDEVSADLRVRAPYVSPNGLLPYSTAWISIQKSGSVAEMGYRVTPDGHKYVFVYATDNFGNVLRDEDVLDITTTALSFHTFDIKKGVALTGVAWEFWYDSYRWNAYSIYTWSGTRADTGLQINDAASMMFGTSASYYYAEYLTYRSQYGTGAWTANNVIRNDNTNYFGAWIDSGNNFVAYDKNCT